MTTPTPSAEPVKKRRTIPIILIILATIVGIMSVLALWASARRSRPAPGWIPAPSCSRTRRFRTRSADFIVNTIYETSTSRAEIASALPPKAAMLAGPIRAACARLRRGHAGGAPAEKVQALWEDANRVAHERLLALIEDKGKFVSTTDGRSRLT